MGAAEMLGWIKKVLLYYNFKQHLILNSKDQPAKL